MTNPLERRYRRVLRLLPAGYRQRWEEDMVSSFMEGAQASNSSADGRVGLGEGLSVVALAMRVRLNGSHATPRGLVLRRAVHGLALIVLLCQALAATVTVSSRVHEVLTYPVAAGTRSPVVDLLVSSQVFRLLWVAAFGCFVLRRFVAARVLVVLALVATIAVTVITHVIVAGHGVGAPPFGAGELSRWGWLAVSVLAVFVGSPDAQASRRFWFEAYVVGALLWLGPTLTFLARDRQWLEPADLVDTASWMTIVTMAVVLVRTAVRRPASAHWLFALAAFAGGLGCVQLFTTLAAAPVPVGQPSDTVGRTAIAAILIILAVVCAIVGLLALRRRPGAALSTG